MAVEDVGWSYCDYMIVEMTAEMTAGYIVIID